MCLRGRRRRRDTRFLSQSVVLERFVYSGQRLVRGVLLVLAHVPVPVTALGARVRVHLAGRVRRQSQAPSRPADLVLRPGRVLGYHGPRTVRPYPQQARVQTARPVIVTCPATRQIAIDDMSNRNIMPITSLYRTRNSCSQQGWIGPRGNGDFPYGEMGIFPVDSRLYLL